MEERREVLGKTASSCRFQKRYQTRTRGPATWSDKLIICERSTLMINDYLSVIPVRRLKLDSLSSDGRSNGM